MDRYSRAKRSEIMGLVRSMNTRPEVVLRRALWKAELRGWRLTPPRVPGRPDLAFIGRRIAIFVDGCFWHGCAICYRRPKSNRTYWDKKLRRNIERDDVVAMELQAAGWTCIRLWEHEVRDDLVECVRRVKEAVAAASEPREAR